MNYQNKKKSTTKFINYGKRGMNLENDINITNKYYLENNIAIVYKKPTPIKVVKVDYNKRINTVIKEAYYEVPSTTYYNGIYNGKYIDFEAKETKSTTSFALRNIHDHQIKHLIKVLEHGGISFLIIRFTILNKTFFLDTKYLKDFLTLSKSKSIPLKYIEDNGYIIEEKYYPRVDYIKIIEKYYLGVKNEK